MNKNKHFTYEKKEWYVKRNLDDVILTGIVRYHGIPLENFSKEQLIVILHRVTSEEG